MSRDAVRHYEMQPATYADWCLDRVATALEAIAAGLGTPEAESELGTPLPEDFPGRDLLHEAGVAYLESVPRTGALLEALGLSAQDVVRVLVWQKMEL